MSEPSPGPGTTPLIFELRDIRAGYGSIEVVHGVSLEVPTGSVVALLGPNGGGKTTLLNVCAGTLTPSTERSASREPHHWRVRGRPGAPRYLHRA